jgi:asparagine synthase (glutamine-hydrolysing)
MTAMLVHRGPDAGGTWQDPEAGVALGHRRLAVLDLSEAGRQPMMSASERFIIVFNGEIYNHLDLRRDLAAGGTALPWRGHSDTETLLACFEAWGIAETLRRITGMFAFALWDRGNRALTLARDRLGEKPLYYAIADGQIWFASELKALRACPDLHLDIDRDAAALFFRYAYVPTPHTIYRGVRKLPPGTSVTFAGDAIRETEPSPYWSLHEVATRANAQASCTDWTADEASTALETLLGRVVRSQMLSDAPLGTFLSGGVDSSLITALMAAGAERKIRSFSIGFGDPRFNEAAHARAVAAHLGTDHTELIATEEHALEIVPRLARTFDEPFADSSQIPTMILSELTRRHVTVAMSGDGGDELFGGYNRYLYAPRLWDRYASLPQLLRCLLTATAMGLPSSRYGIGSVLAFLSRRAGLHITFADKIARYGETLAAARTFNQVFRNLVEEWPRTTVLVPGAAGLNLLDQEEQWPSLGSREETMMALDAVTYLPDGVLVKVDRSAMAASLETRAPFLDREVVEFAFGLPLSLKIQDGRGKQILRRILDRYVPRELIDRPKQGFAVPLDDWLRGRLRDWAESLLAEKQLADGELLDPAPIRVAWLDHSTGRRQLGTRLWAVLMFQAWREEARQR